MNSPAAADDSGNSRLQQALAEYLLAVEAGAPSAEDALVAKYPDLADELRSYFSDRAAMERIIAPLKGSAFDPTIGAAVAESAETPKVRYFGDYELLTELGRGGMGVVYKARQMTLNRLVALKMILSGQLASSDDVLRFKQEAEAAANLDHPHIAPIYETGEHDGRQYFSMKLIEGRSLRDALPEMRTDAGSGVVVLAQVARAVHHAHQRGVLHRDLKPANILLDRRQTPYVTDFGLAKRVEGDSDVTKTGAIVGTPSYMAPEQARGEKLLSTAVDVYGLGAILYELLAGVPPFRSDSPLETLVQVTTREPMRPRAINPAADRDLETIALRCLAKDPVRRYDSAAALADEFERWLRGEPILARPVGATERAVRWCKRNPAIASLAATAAGLLVVGTVTASFFAYTADHRAKAAVASELRAQDEKRRADDNAARADEKAVEAENNLQRAIFSKRQADEHLYVAHLNLVQQAFALNNPPRGLELLERHRPPTGEVDLRGFEWHYWHRQGHLFAHDLPHDGERPTNIGFTPDGNSVVTFTGETARVWDVKTRTLKISHGLPKGATFVRLSPRGDVLAVTQYWRHVEVWDIATMMRRVELPVEAATAAFSNDGALLAVSPAKTAPPDGKGRLMGEEVELWDWVAKKRLGVLRPETASISNLEFTPDDTSLVIVGHKGLSTWNTAARELEAKTDAKIGGRMAFAPDGETFVIHGANPSALEVWKRKPLEKTTEWKAPAGEHLSSRSFTPDGSLYTAAGDNRKLIFWNVESGEVVKTIAGFSPGELDFSPDGRTFGTASYDDRLCRLWDLPMLLVGEPDEWPNHTVVEKTDKAYIRHSPIAFSPDGRMFASGGRDKLIRLIDVATEKTIKSLEGLPHSPCDLAFSPDGKSLAVGFNPSFGFMKMRIYDVATGTSKDWPLTSKNFFSFVGWSTDGRRLAVGGMFGVDFLDPADGTIAHSLANDNFGAFAYSPDRRTFAVVRKREIDLRAAGDETKGRVLYKASGDIGSLAFSHDGRLLAADGGDLSIRLWDLPAGDESRSLAGHSAKVIALAFSPDGRTLASAGLDRTIKFWNIGTGEPVATFETGDKLPHRVAFCPDGKLFVVSFLDGTIRLWRAE